MEKPSWWRVVKQMYRAPASAMAFTQASASKREG